MDYRASLAPVVVGREIADSNQKSELVARNYNPEFLRQVQSFPKSSFLFFTTVKIQKWEGVEQ